MIKTLLILQAKPKCDDSAAWEDHLECNDQTHAKWIMSSKESIVNSLPGKNFHWRVVKRMTKTEIVSEEVMIRNNC